MFFGPVACGALAFVAGFAFPNGFYLWGFALNLHGPFMEALTVYIMYEEGIKLAVGPGGIASYVVISASAFVFTTLLCSALSAFEMGARHLARWLTRR